MTFDFQTILSSPVTENSHHLNTGLVPFPNGPFKLEPGILNLTIQNRTFFIGKN
jgi:hypothetical protein